MAVRDRNMFVWQAYVIASTIVSLMLLVGMFFLWRAWSDNSRTLASTREQLNTAQQNGTAADGRVKRLLSMLGKGQFTEDDLTRMAETYKSDPELGPVEEEFEKMRTLFPANTPSSDKNLLRLPQLLLDTIRLRNLEVAEARNRNNALEAQMVKELEDHRRARETAEVAQQKAEKDLADARVSHQQQLQKANQLKDEAVAAMDSNKSHFDSQMNEMKTKLAKLETEGREMSETILKKVEQIQQFEDPDFAAPQGRITYVTDGGTRAYINLGSRNGLRKGVTFSILDVSELETTKATPKARMVIQDVSENSAVGEVYFGSDSDSRNKFYRNVVKQGDQVFSPVWRPGRKVSFALVGKMDVDGNFEDDIELVRQLIIRAGGVIDAEMPARGAEKGKITASTNYLVVGTDVESIAETPNGGDKARDYARFMSAAKSKHLTEITVDKLLGYLKVDESTRVLPLGSQIQGSDFKVRNQITPPASTGRVSEIYDPDRNSP